MSSFTLYGTIDHKAYIKRELGSTNRIENTDNVRSSPVIHERILSYQQGCDLRDLLVLFRHS